MLRLSCCAPFDAVRLDPCRLGWATAATFAAPLAAALPLQPPPAQSNSKTVSYHAPSLPRPREHDWRARQRYVSRSTLTVHTAMENIANERSCAYEAEKVRLTMARGFTMTASGLAYSKGRPV